VTVPANFTAELAKRWSRATRWAEIEGLPYAYGTRAIPGSFWSSLPLPRRFAECRPHMTERPAGVDVQLDPLEGMGTCGSMEFRIADVDGFLTTCANVGRDDTDTTTRYLNAAITGATTTVTLAGGDLSAWPASGLAYVGLTTLSYAGKSGQDLTGCVMGLYRSPASEHTQGEAVTLWPQGLDRRRLWYYLALGASPAPSDAVARYAGVIADFSLDGSSTWVLQVQTPEKEELGDDVMLFSGLRSGTLATSLPRAG
jgi:hypothetical protein